MWKIWTHAILWRTNSEKGSLIWILLVGLVAEGPHAALDFDFVAPYFVRMHGPLAPGVGFTQRFADSLLILAFRLLQDSVDDRTGHIAPGSTHDHPG